MEKQIKQQVINSYQQVNDKWMYFHLKLLAICNVLICLVEVIMFFIFLYYDKIDYSVLDYCMKFILAPVVSNSTITLGANYLIKNNKISSYHQSFIISFSFVLFTFILSIAHSSYVGILAALSLPVILTIMYERSRLTTSIALISSLLQLISGLSMFWDDQKAITFGYLVNLLILVVVTFFVWLISIMMIHFFKMKKEVIIKNDIERYHLQQRIQIDALTSVGNKYALEHYLQTVQGNQEDIVYLAMIDLDHFKQLNDTYGHVFGDEVLRYVGDCMQIHCRQAKSFRYGGDEFCIVFKNISLAKIKTILTSMQQDISEHFEIPDQDYIVSLSVGLARYKKEYSAIKLLEGADTALYQSKTKSGYAISIFTENKR